MGQQARHTESPSTKKPPSGLVGTAVHVVFLILLMSILAWILLCVVFGFYQVIHGSEQTKERMNTIISLNIVVMKSDTHFLVANGYATFETSQKGLLNEMLVKTHLLDGLQWLNQKVEQDKGTLQKQMPTFQLTLQKIWQKTIQPFLTVLWGVTVIIFTRSFILLLALPVFLLFVGLGLVDGLVQRDVRKFQAARESTYLFHRVRKTWQGCFFIPLFLYLVWPWAVSPVWFLIPMAMMLGWLMQISVTSFKKYL